MANRHTLSVNAIDGFELWLVNNGWTIESPRGEYEVLRARKDGRQRPLIIWRRIANRSGTELTHLTFDNRDGGVVAAFLRGGLTMSILIRGIDMPKNGDVFMFAVSSNGEVDVHQHEDLTYITLKDRAVTIPPHGRLIIEEGEIVEQQSN